MNVQEAEIEQIVREVMRQLNAVTPVSNGQALTAPPNGSTTNSSHVLELTARVVTLAEISEKLVGVRQLVVRRGAVVTPAVRDLLRERKVDLSYQIQKPTGKAIPDKATKAVARTIVLGLADTKYEPAKLIQLLRQQGTQSERVANSGLLSVMDELSDRVAINGELAILLTGRAQAAVCLANRQRGVRAIVAAQQNDISDGIKLLGANMIVINPAGRSQFELRRMVELFCRPESRDCPTDLQHRLG
ncbi:MAG: hypothetical protein SGJ20_01995 [Planctomycetota bacterium]|nr:hypothetical protein [Planctomycetota bacterium]